MNNLHILNNNCRRCELSRKCKKIHVGKGNLNAKIMLVIDPPCAYTEDSNNPFSTRSGFVLKQLLDEANIDDYYITPIVKCPNFERRGKFKKPLDHQPHHIAACKHWIWEELKLVRPKVVMTMGKLAVDVLLELDKNITLKSIVGEHIRVSYIDSIFIPTYSLAYLTNLSKWHTTKTSKYFKIAKEICYGL